MEKIEKMLLEKLNDEKDDAQEIINNLNKLLYKIEKKHPAIT